MRALAATSVLLPLSVSVGWAECRIVSVQGPDGTWKTYQVCDHIRDLLMTHDDVTFALKLLALVVGVILLVWCIFTYILPSLGRI